MTLNSADYSRVKRLYEGWGDKPLLDELDCLSSKSRSKPTVVCEESGFVNAVGSRICLHCRRESKTESGALEGEALLAQTCKTMIWCEKHQIMMPKRGVKSRAARQMETLLDYRKRLTDPRRYQLGGHVGRRPCVADEYDWVRPHSRHVAAARPSH